MGLVGLWGGVGVGVGGVGLRSAVVGSGDGEWVCRGRVEWVVSQHIVTVTAHCHSHSTLSQSQHFRHSTLRYASG